jgi:hypothetical protein
MNLTLNLLIAILLLFGLYGAGNLSLADYRKSASPAPSTSTAPFDSAQGEPAAAPTTSGLCPKLGGIPACYIILICFLMAAVGHVPGMPKGNLIYFIFTGFAASIALYGTVGELAGFAECPKGSSGTPMCFYSLAIFGSLISVKVFAVLQAE